MERPIELLPTEDLSPVLSGLVPCNPVALDIGGSLVKIVFWERENGPRLPEWVRPDTGPEHLPLRPLSRPSRAHPPPARSRGARACPLPHPPHQTAPSRPPALVAPASATPMDSLSSVCSFLSHPSNTHMFTLCTAHLTASDIGGG